MDINKIEELINKNYSYTKIAKEFNMSVSSTKRKMKEIGLKTKFNPFARVNVDIEKLKSLVNQNLSTYDIAQTLNTSKY